MDQVSANNRANEGFAYRQPPSDFSSSVAIGSHATKDHSNQVPLYNDAKIANSAIVDANSGKMPMPYNLYREGKGKNIIQSGAEGVNPRLFSKPWGMRPSTSVVPEFGATQGNMPFDAAAVENRYGPIRRFYTLYLLDGNK